MLKWLLEFHYDCRERIYDAVSALSPEEFDRPLAPGWQSIHGTLVHCLRAEMFWIQHGILGEERPRHDPASFPTIDDVRALASAVRDSTQAFFAGLGGAGLAREHSVTTSVGDTVRYTADGAILHVVLHDAHHRGEVTAMLKQLGYEPPLLDLLTRQEQR